VTPALLGVAPRVVAHSVPKLGRGTHENEDGVAFDTATGRFAVADGASTSARPEVWSALLVRSFVEHDVDPFEPAALAGLRRRWHALVADGARLPWYATAKLQHGADSTFLGLRVRRGGYAVTAVGDSCLFHVRGGRVLLMAPAIRPEEFGRFPPLVSSRPDAPVPAAVTVDGEHLPGDLFVLATDAVAQFLIAGYTRHGRFPVTGLGRDRAAFLRAVTSLRGRAAMANDDSTLCVVRV
jgi:hypothetical protein